jgi:hypothetical protein
MSRVAEGRARTIVGEMGGLRSETREVLEGLVEYVSAREK